MLTEKIKQKILVPLGMLGFVYFLGFGIGSSKYMPDNAFVYVNDDTKILFAPPCVSEVTGLRLMTASEAHRLAYKADRNCVNEGSYYQEMRSLSGQLLVKLRILEPLPSRWNEDGSWNF